jgi:hypothetical protein
LNVALKEEILKKVIMQIKIILSALVLMIVSIAASAQDDDGWESKNFKTDNFSEIRIEGAFKVFLIQGDNCSVKVKSTGSDVFDNIKINNFQNEVEIKMEQSVFDFSRINLYITFKTLEKLDIEGGVMLKTNGYLDINNLAVKVSGGANVDLYMKADEVKIYGEGGFLFDLKGVANLLDININGAGHVNGAELKTKEVSFTAVGFGTGSVYATEKLNAKIEGVGKLRYKGDPKVSQYIDGLGSVKPYVN